jgi:hypothetical protein
MLAAGAQTGQASSAGPGHRRRHLNNRRHRQQRSPLIFRPGARSLVAGERAHVRGGRRSGKPRQHVHASSGPIAAEAFHFLETERGVKAKAGDVARLGYIERLVGAGEDPVQAGPRQRRGDTPAPPRRVHQYPTEVAASRVPGAASSAASSATPRAAPEHMQHRVQQHAAPHRRPMTATDITQQRKDPQRSCCRELRKRWSHGVRLMGVPLPCQNRPTQTGNQGHSGDIRTTPELPTRSSGARWRQPDKDEVGGSSPPGPTTRVHISAAL